MFKEGYMVIGVDRGTTYTKTDKGISIKSTLRKLNVHDIIDDDVIVTEIDGQRWVVGEAGCYETDLMKSEHFGTRILTLTAIALSYPYDDYITTDLVTGLPIGLYSKQKQSMRNMFQGCSAELKINGIRKNIKIKNVEVFPEAAGAFYSQTDFEDALIIDIGGISVDTAEFVQKKLKKYSTYAMGTMKLFSKIANRINSEYDISLTEWDIEDILKDGCLYICGQREDLNVADIVMEHTDRIFEKLSLEYDLKSKRNIILTGAPANWFAVYFRRNIPQIQIMKNSKFANAIGYANIGSVVFK